MDKILDYCKREKITILISVVVILLGSGYFLTHQSKTVTAQEKVENTAPVKKTKSLLTKSKTNNSKQLLVVDIEGAVQKPGVYRLKKDSIVQDALAQAGGVNAQADMTQINRAKKLTDQMQLYVPIKGEKTPSVTTGGNTNSEKKVVNINTATVDDFKDVSGIGPKKAEKIIAFREQNGDFKDLHDLTKVSGFGEKTIERLKDQLTV